MAQKQLFILALLVAMSVAQFRFPFFGGGRPRRPAPRPQQTFFNRRPAPFRPGPPAPQVAPAPAAPAFNRPAPAPPAPSGGGACQEDRVHICIGSQKYYLGWRDDNVAYTWGGAKAACSRRNGKLASLDNPNVSETLMATLGRDRAPYFWAGGVIRGPVVQFENGRSQRYTRGQHPWSFIRNQPETTNECLAVLNDFYGDGLKWHDVACHHKKPVACEVPN